MPKLASLATRTLLQIALGACAVLAVVGALTYAGLYREIQVRTQEGLTASVVARARDESETLRFARDVQHAIVATVIDNYPRYQRAATRARFDQLFQRYPDGAIRSRGMASPGVNAVTGWLRSGTRLTDELRLRMVLFHDVAEQYRPLVLTRLVDFFFTAPEQLNIGTDPPGFPQWARHVAADFDQNAEDWAGIATPQRDPARDTVWEPPNLDPVWKRWMSGAATPIDIDGRHIGTIYNDLLLELLVRPAAPGDAADAVHCVFDRSGLLIAHSALWDRIAASAGRLHVDETADPGLQAVFSAALASRTLPVSGFDAVSKRYYAISRIDGPDWYFASMQPAGVLVAQATQAAKFIVSVGVLTLILLLALLAAVLRRRITRPLERLTAMAEGMASGGARAAVVTAGGDELGRLAQVFDTMADNVAARDQALRRETSELQAALTALRNTEERWRALTEHGADIIAVVDDDWQLQYVSPSIEPVLGYQRAEVIGRPLATVFGADGVQRLREEIGKQFRSGRGGHIESVRVTLLNRAGAPRILEGVARNLRSNPVIRGWVVNARDITERVGAEAALQQSEKLASMGSLLAGVAHELNNPLSVVAGRALMLDEATADPETRKAAQKILSAARRCERIVATFLAMSRQRQPRMASINIREVIRTSLEVLEHGLETDHIAVTVRCPPEVPALRGDADQLHQVFINLFVNAQHAMSQCAMPRRLSVIVEPREASQSIEVRVVDTGSGIAPELRSRIFDPYFTTKPMGVGAGVGLSVCLAIVQAHGGRLSVVCPASGGAEFTVSLPRVPAPCENARPS